jgi:hypothetical protein
MSATPTAVAATAVADCAAAFSGNGFLAADLDCSAHVGQGITIDGGTLDLRGFTLTAGSGGPAVFCTKNCRVVSDPAGGRIIGASGGAIATTGSDKIGVKVSGVVLDGNDDVIFAGGKVAVEDSTITNSGPASAIDTFGPVLLARTTIDVIGEGVHTTGTLKMTDVDISNCGQTCVFGGRVRIRGSQISNAGQNGVTATEALAVFDSTITLNGAAGIENLGFKSLRIVRSAVTSNSGRGVSSTAGGAALVSESDISGNALEGIVNTGKFKVSGSTVNGNGRSGISGGAADQSSCTPVRLLESTATGNGTDVAVCGVSETCADVATCVHPPELKNSSCSTSYDTASGFPGTSWGVCSND